MNTNQKIRKEIEQVEKIKRFMYINNNQIYKYIIFDETGKSNCLFEHYVIKNHMVLRNIDELKTHILNSDMITNVKIVIFSYNYPIIAKELSKLGLNAYEQIFDGEIIITEKEEPDKNNTQRIIFSAAGSGEVGGVFQYEFAKDSFVKILEGDFREIKKIGNGYIALNESKGIMFFDDGFNLLKTISLSGLDLHGFDICEQTGLLYLVETAENRIGIYNLETSKKIDNFVIGRDEKKDEYHINDILIDGDSIYLSMFSKSGLFHLNEWSNDGAIVVFDKKDRYLKDIYIDNLCGPHTVYKSLGDIYVCDSMNYTLYRNKKPFLKMPGFIRGVYYDGYCLYIGQSKKRRIIETAYRHSYCSLDAGFHCYNLAGRTTNFIPANFTKNIYSIIVE